MNEYINSDLKNFMIIKTVTSIFVVQYFPRVYILNTGLPNPFLKAWVLQHSMVIKDSTKFALY